MSAENTGGHILELDGEIDLHESPRVKELLHAGITAKPAHLIVDLSKVTYIDSSGLATFIEALQKVQAIGGRFSLVGIRDNVRTIFQISRLDKVFTIYPDRDSALNA